MKLVYGSHLKDEGADVLAARLAGPHRPSAQPRAAPPSQALLRKVQKDQCLASMATTTG